MGTWDRKMKPIVVVRCAGQAWIGPRAVVDQSYSAISLAVSPPFDRKAGVDKI